MDNFDSLVDQLDAFLGNRKKKRPEAPNFIFIPPRMILVRSWLTTYPRREDNSYEHWFNPVGKELQFLRSRSSDHFKDSGLVIHNHEFDKPCYSPDFCFEWGYEPPVGEPFTEFFFQKNGKYFATKTVPQSVSTSTSTSSLHNLFDF